MKTIRAKTFIEIACVCPECGALDDKFDSLREYFDDEPRAENINAEVKCSECGEEYIVESIDF